MKIEVGYLPKNYFSGHFPFELDGEYIYSVEVDPCGSDPTGFYSDWMKELNQFPIYAVVTLDLHTQEEIDRLIEKYKIDCSVFLIGNESYNKFILRNEEQFGVLLPYFYAIGSMNDLAVWSLKKDIFSSDRRKVNTIFRRKTMDILVATFKGDTTLFWITYDGDGLDIISNHPIFRTMEDIEKTLPKGVEMSVVEYEMGEDDIE
ncbi:hypothetical protein [Mesobacillus jeotgali]|uniref:DUF1643 domain-containing protein n=1 Tax=Mesobacillus jeotgali TaxID=129985 RepID=A0ABY9VLH2_9BACI|nr:hypothetical protein [Mesobacillus jeotgali]WNF24821.1 hypothetical protein RH061_10185 [Mesobacillus jeotgali]